MLMLEKRVAGLRWVRISLRTIAQLSLPVTCPPGGARGAARESPRTTPEGAPGGRAQTTLSVEWRVAC